MNANNHQLLEAIAAKAAMYRDAVIEHKHHKHQLQTELFDAVEAWCCYRRDELTDDIERDLIRE